MDFTPVKEFMDHLTAWRIPGNSIRVSIGDKEVFTYASGYADLETKEPMTTTHLVNLYSCSKPTTVTAALQLYEQGKIKLDDPVYAYIPEYRQMNLADGTKAKNPMTLRHLFTMTSGLTYNKNTPAFEKARELSGGKMDTLTVIRCLAEDPLSFEPGTKWQYSLSHDVLAAVVEVVSGEKFRDFVKRNIFDPLGMENCVYHNEEVQDKMATKYRFVDGVEGTLVEKQSGDFSREGGYIQKEGRQSAHIFGPEYDSGGSGITASVAEYSKFCDALANGGKGILQPETIDLMRTNQIANVDKSLFNWRQLNGYGYGLGVRTLLEIPKDGNGNIGEFGWGGAAGASLWIDPEYKLSVFYAHHMLNPQESYYQPRMRNAIYESLK